MCHRTHSACSLIPSNLVGFLLFHFPRNFSTGPDDLPGSRAVARPPSGERRVERMGTAVVFPAPFRPRSPSTVPSSTCRSTPASAWTSTYDFVRPTASITQQAELIRPTLLRNRATPDVTAITPTPFRPVRLPQMRPTDVLDPSPADPGWVVLWHGAGRRLDRSTAPRPPRAAAARCRGTRGPRWAGSWVGGPGRHPRARPHARGGARPGAPYDARGWRRRTLRR